MTAQWMVVICIAVFSLSPQSVISQIPVSCSDAESLRNMECCPNNCGGPSRGRCVNIDLPSGFNVFSTDVRANWPHYFRRACSCNGNYGGYDCSRCKYGYYGSNCIKDQNRPRKSIYDLNDMEWQKYIGILKMTRTYPSGYKVVLNENRPGSTNNIMTVDIKLYNLFIWQHHYAAKNNECDGMNCPKIDYAHEATGFPTWHRQFVLWFEWEIQWMLESMGDQNYYTFRTHYWDWRRETQMANDDIFVRNRLGESVNSQVHGDLFDGGWNTTCWNMQMGTTCDPRINTGPLLRCPLLGNKDPCDRTNTDWPTRADVDKALGKQQYDTQSYNKRASEESFRNFMEGFDSTVSIDDCRSDPQCLCEGRPDCTGDNPGIPLKRNLHNLIHIIVGTVNLKSGLDDNIKGVMADVAASPNDPLFVNHHTTVDCILEEWLQHNPNARYPDNVPRNNEIKGHQKNEYIVPFFPLFKHSDMFKTADNFGYSCNLFSSSSGGNDLSVLIHAAGSLLVSILMVIL